MSDWIDLQLAHSLTPTRAPEELWARIRGAKPEPRRRRSPVRWAVPAALAAGVMVVLAQPVRQEHFELTAGRPAKIERWLAHQPGESGPLRPVVAIQDRDGSCRQCHVL